MKLVLHRGYPFPYPKDLSEDEQDELAGNTVDMSLTGVVHFEWTDTVTVEFKDAEALRAAVEATGWPYWGDLILEAPTSVEDGYGHHAAIIVRDKAYCGFFVKLEEAG